MYSKKLLESEDRGMGELLTSQDFVNDIVQSEDIVAPPVDLVNLVLANVLLDTPNVATTTVVHAQLVSEEDSNVKLNSYNVLPDYAEKIISDYEGLTKKLMYLVNLPSTQAATQATFTQFSAQTHRQMQGDQIHMTK